MSELGVDTAHLRESQQSREVPGAIHHHSGGFRIDFRGIAEFCLERVIHSDQKANGSGVTAPAPTHTQEAVSAMVIVFGISLMTAPRANLEAAARLLWAGIRVVV